MATKKPLAIPVGQDPKGWSDIRSAWSRHQVASQGGYEMEILRDFVVATLADLERDPTRLSPQAYARFFDTMSALAPWRKFGTYQQNVRMPIMIALGMLAERSGAEKVQSGRGVAAEYMRQMTLAFDGMLFSSSKDTTIAQDFLQFLQSPLCDLFKLRISKNFTFPETWLQPEIIVHLRPLLPEKPKDAFKFFPWDPMNPASNKSMVSTYLPEAYTLLDLSLPDDAWEQQDLVTKALAAIAPSRKQKANSVAFDLPSDFLGEP